MKNYLVRILVFLIFLPLNPVTFAEIPAQQESFDAEVPRAEYLKTESPRVEGLHDEKAHGDSFSVETEPIETRLENAQVTQKDSSDNSLVIELKNGTKYYFDATPDPEKMKQSLGIAISAKMKEKILAAGGTLVEPNPMASFESLTAEKKLKFMEVRKLFLTAAARILSSGKITLGAGGLVGEALKFVRIKIVNSTEKIIEKSTGRKFEYLENQFKKLSLLARGEIAIQTTLRGIDYQLWSQAPLVIDANEFGISSSIGIVGQSGILNKGFGGVEEIGFSLAFNKSSRSFIFEIYHNSEVYDNSKAAITVVGMVGKLGPMMSRRDGIANLKGSSFYPPGIPGYSTMTSEYFSAGISSSIGLPPPPFADLQTVTNKSERRNWLRLTISPVIKGYVRVEVGDLKGSLQTVTGRFNETAKIISKKFILRKHPQCAPLFAFH